MSCLLGPTVAISELLMGFGRVSEQRAWMRYMSCRTIIMTWEYVVNLRIEIKIENGFLADEEGGGLDHKSHIFNNLHLRERIPCHGHSFLRAPDWSWKMSLTYSRTRKTNSGCVFNKFQCRSRVKFHGMVSKLTILLNCIEVDIIYKNFKQFKGLNLLPEHSCT